MTYGGGNGYGWREERIKKEKTEPKPIFSKYSHPLTILAEHELNVKVEIYIHKKSRGKNFLIPFLG